MKRTKHLSIQELAARAESQHHRFQLDGDVSGSSWCNRGAAEYVATLYDTSKPDVIDRGQCTVPGCTRCRSAETGGDTVTIFAPIIHNLRPKDPGYRECQAYNKLIARKPKVAGSLQTKIESERRWKAQCTAALEDARKATRP